MTSLFSARTWLLMLSLDALGAVLLLLGIMSGATLLIVAGVALVASTSVLITLMVLRNRSGAG
ncbi:MAG TPA: hypothetical protein PKI89_05400 [Tepidiformaceae bacterium]|nr:hypothetical protein [Tepidiformaceae bacterium]